MKKLLAMLLAALMVMSVLASCGTTVQVETGDAEEETEAADTEAAEEEAEEATGDVIEIRACWWGDTGRNDMYNEILNRFMAENPDIKVVGEPTSWADYWEKIPVQIAGGNAPDFMAAHFRYASEYASKGCFADLKPFVDNGILDISKFGEGTLDSMYFDGVLCMLPMGLTFVNYITNKTLCEKYGVEPFAETENFSWEEFAEKGQEFVDAAQAAGDDVKWVSSCSSFNFDTNFSYFINAISEEKTLFTTDGDFGFEQEDIVAFLNYWKDLMDRGIATDIAEGVEDNSNALENKLLTLGKVATYQQSANQIALHRDAMPDSEVVLMKEPGAVDAAFPTEYIEGAQFAVNAASSPEKQEAAARLLNFWLNSEASYELFKIDQGVPANTDMQEYVKSISDDTTKYFIDFVSENSEFTRPNNFPPAGYSECNDVFSSYAQSFYYGEITAEEAAEAIFTEGKEIIGK